MFRIALDAGHGINTQGKRCLKALDGNETREWWLNNRICVNLEKKLSSYDGYSLIRVDDKTGKSDVSLGDRVEKANRNGADVYISIHHNAGINGGSGGGAMVLIDTTGSEQSKEYQKLIYDELINRTGLKGNRSNPMPKQSLYVCKHTYMPAVLIECGFMDSRIDVPIILSEKFANDAAEALLNVLVKKGNLTKKANTVTSTDQSGKLYRVQVGAYSVKANAEAMLKKLKADGYDGYIV